MIFFFFLQASSHIYTLKEKRQFRRYSESSAFGFISKENQKKKKKSKYSDSWDNPEGEGKVYSLAGIKNDNLDHTLKLYCAEESLRDLIKMQILHQ